MLIPESSDGVAVTPFILGVTVIVALVPDFIVIVCMIT
jgi:hypothetical protein